jgi:hypothetical protein
MSKGEMEQSDLFYFLPEGVGIEPDAWAAVVLVVTLLQDVAPHSRLGSWIDPQLHVRERWVE